MVGNVKYIGLIIGVGFVLSLPLILYGFPFYSSDIQHSIWYSHFSSQLWSGEFYPRWLAGMNGGFGSPTFFFYAPVPYYLTALLRPFFVQDTQGWHQLGISTAIALAASGVCAYLWLKKIATPKAAFVAALIYTAMPYHLATNVYDRGAFAETWTFVWMPLVLLFTEELSRGRSSAVIGLVVSYALLIMTQLPTTLMFSLVPICYGCYLAGRNRIIKMAAIMLGAMALSFGLSAIYLLPALAMQKYIFMEDLTLGFYYYGHWFLPLQPASIKATTITIAQTVPQVATLGSFAFLIARRATNSNAKKKAAFWMVVLLLSVFMMLSLSSFVWRLITPLQMIQFPFRFSTVLCVATAALIALGMSSATKFSVSARLISGLAVLMTIVWLGYAVRWAQNGYGTVNFSPATVHKPIRRQELLNSDVNEFRPRWVVSLQEPALESLQARIGESADGLTNVKIVEGIGTVDLKGWKPREIEFQVDSPTGAVLQVSQFYFPGWSAFTADEPCGLKVEPSKPGGLVKVHVPRGNHRVTLLLTQTLPEYAGGLISVVSAFLLLLMVGSFVYRGQNPIREEETSRNPQ